MSAAVRSLAPAAAALVAAAAAAMGVIFVRFLYLTRPAAMKACPTCAAPLTDAGECPYSFPDLD